MASVVMVERKYVEADRTFFCSELIAKAYKVLGIIEDDDRSCAKFYPSSFSSKQGELKFTSPNIYLEPELNIICTVINKQNCKSLK
jgi:uncharacterized protein YycO